MGSPSGRWPRPRKRWGWQREGMWTVSPEPCGNDAGSAACAPCLRLFLSNPTSSEMGEPKLEAIPTCRGRKRASFPGRRVLT